MIRGQCLNLFVCSILRGQNPGLIVKSRAKCIFKKKVNINSRRTKSSRKKKKQKKNKTKTKTKQKKQQTKKKEHVCIVYGNCFNMGLLLFKKSFF